jgi:hypothetical protein
MDADLSVHTSDDAAPNAPAVTVGKYLTHLEPVCTEKLEPVSHSADARELQ